MYCEVGVRCTPRGFRQIALSISFLSPIVRVPVVFRTTKMASLIFLPDWRFLALTFFHSRTWPSLSLGSSSLISRRRQSRSLSRPRFRPPGNIQSRSLLRRTNRTLPALTATSFDDLAIEPTKSCHSKSAHEYRALAGRAKATPATSLMGRPVKAERNFKCSPRRCFARAIGLNVALIALCEISYRPGY
jgi:hypothetical protein